MLDEGDKLVPGLSRARVLRAWAGVRPLYQEGFAGESRDATRALTLLDHRHRDGVAGLLTITGGKWTTFRLMAETTVDKACAQLGDAPPLHHGDTPVPGIEQGHYWLGHRLHEVEEHRLQGRAGLRVRTGHACHAGARRGAKSDPHAGRPAPRCSPGHGAVPGWLLHLSARPAFCMNARSTPVEHAAGAPTRQARRTIAVQP